MEEKVKQIQTYLSTKANPIIQPMLEQMAKERPESVLPWIQTYINKKMRNIYPLLQNNNIKNKPVIPLMMKLMKSSSGRKWSESRKMVAKKSVDKESALKSMENLTKNLASNHKSSKRALKLKK